MPHIPHHLVLLLLLLPILDRLLKLWRGRR
jgi:hypothetical protein